MKTPNANGVAWLLGQHKKEMGIAAVDEIVIFSAIDPKTQDASWCLYFHIKLVDDSDEDIDEDESDDADDSEDSDDDDGPETRTGGV